jgi:endo-1,4-beta-xylanase
MKTKAILLFFLLGVVISFAACKKSSPDNNSGNTGGNNGGGSNNPLPTALKDASSIPVGVGADYDAMKNNSSYSSLVKAQFDRVTATYQMKHGANVKSDGSYDFSKTDDFVTIAQAAGLLIHGHTLVWHQNNNTAYLKSLAATTGNNLMVNPDFENGFSNWFTQVSATPPTSGNISIETSDVQSGSQCARIIVTTPGPNAYSIQIVSDNFSVNQGSGYQLKFWAKAAADGQSLRAVAQGTSYYTAQDQSLTTSWKQYIFNFTPTENSVSIKFHFPNAGTFFIDNMSVLLLSSSLDPVQINNALHNWITTIVTRYKGKVTGWDVANEVIADGTGELRTSANSSTTGSDVFYWADYLGRSYIDSAFQWAHAADPDAKLFINDYNLESDSRKLDSLIALINRLKSSGAPIQGVGLQMHININTDNGGIDNALRKLAATGLLIHVSEMDVRMNPSNNSSFTETSDLLNQQAAKFRYVAESYFKNVPAAQRYGITVWNLTDADSWIVAGGHTDYPTLFDAGYHKKPAFDQFILGLQ